MRDHLLQNLDNISALFLALMIMAEHTHLLRDISRFDTMIANTGPIIKHTVGKTIEAIREINGTLNIDHRKHNLIFKLILEKWARILTPAYNFQEMQDCLLDICDNIVEDYNEFPIIITNAISITSIIIGFIQNRLKEE
jgi:hypothetical protein